MALPEMLTGVVGLVILVFLVALGIYWLLFPWFMYSKMDKLIALQKESNAIAERFVGEVAQLRRTEPASRLPQSGPPAEPAYWVRIGSDTNGPFPIDKIRELRKRGTIEDETPVAAEGSSEWKKAGEVV
jgi:hypothetical protein